MDRQRWRDRDIMTEIDRQRRSQRGEDGGGTSEMETVMERMAGLAERRLVAERVEVE